MTSTTTPPLTMTAGVQPALFALDDTPDYATQVDAGWRAPQVCQVVGITYRQLDYWARTNLVQPSVRTATGSGSQRLYSFRDLVIIKIIKGLLDTGISLQNVRKSLAQLDHLNAGELSELTLFSDGTTVYQCRSTEEVIDLLGGGQGVFGIAVPGLVTQLTGDLVAVDTHSPCEDTGVGDELATRRVAKATA